MMRLPPNNAVRYSGFAFLPLLLFLSALSARAQTTFTLSDAASSFAAQSCDGITPSSSNVYELVTSGATTGSITSAAAASGNGVAGDAWITGALSNAKVSSGSWTVSLDVTTATSGMEWAATCIWEESSGGLVGSLTGQTTDLGTTGVKQQVVSGSATTMASSDEVVVVLVFENTNAHGGAKSVGYDAGGASDTVTTPVSISQAYTPSISDTQTVTDTPSRAAAFGRAPAESQSMGDSPGSASLGYPVSESEGQVVADVIGGRSDFSRTSGETQGTADNAGRQATLGAVTTESQVVSDVMSGQRGMTASASESLSQSDLAARASTYGRSTMESASSSDTTSASAAIKRSPYESFSISDSASRSANFPVTMTETGSVSDMASTSSIGRYLASISETIAVSDSATRRAGLSGLVSDSGVTGDLVSENLASRRSSGDGEAVSDAVSRLGSYRSTLFDSMLVSDAAAGAQGSGYSSFAAFGNEQQFTSDCLLAVWGRGGNKVFLQTTEVDLTIENGDGSPWSGTLTISTGQGFWYQCTTTFHVHGEIKLALFPSITVGAYFMQFSGSGRKTTQLYVPVSNVPVNLTEVE